MDFQRFSHDVRRDQVRIDLVCHKRDERHPNDEHRILDQTDDERWHVCDPRPDERDDVHEKGKHRKQQSEVQADRPITDEKHERQNEADQNLALYV